MSLSSAGGMPAITICAGRHPTPILNEYLIGVCGRTTARAASIIYTTKTTGLRSETSGFALADWL